MSLRRWTSRELPIEIGLAQNTKADSIQTLWMNGIARTKLALQLTGEPVRITIVEFVRSSSCPFLYAWADGAWEFVTDIVGHRAAQRVRGPRRAVAARSGRGRGPRPGGAIRRWRRRGAIACYIRASRSDLFRRGAAAGRRSSGRHDRFLARPGCANRQSTASKSSPAEIHVHRVPQQGRTASIARRRWRRRTACLLRRARAAASVRRIHRAIIDRAGFRRTGRGNQQLPRAHRLVSLWQFVDEHCGVAARRFAGDLAASSKPLGPMAAGKPWKKWLAFRPETRRRSCATSLEDCPPARDACG